MKKYFLLAVLMMVVFLWLGNYSMGQNLTAQQQSNYDNCWDINTVYNPITNTCSAPVDSILPTTSSNYQVIPLTPCWVGMVSSLAWVANAIVSESGIWCKCKPNYGEYYNVNTKTTTCELCSRDDVCCGVKLNTNVPFIGNCLEDEEYTGDPTSVSQERAFPVLMSSLTKILVTVILIVSFVLIVVWGIMIASAWPNQSKASEWRKLIMKVVIGIALLGASGVILRLINPNFFG